MFFYKLIQRFKGQPGVNWWIHCYWDGKFKYDNWAGKMFPLHLDTYVMGLRPL